SQYSWDNLFNTKVTAAEMLRLYSEAIAGMDKNPNIPQLFRDIFKNAFLPYRDPETLKLFLKTVGEFEYTHSEKLGDAFEYLLSVMGSQGDAGQFRTPRHIIDFLVAVVNPGKKDTILDPACGTAGFLISAFKHIKEQNKKGLTPDERKKLIQNFTGYDISPDMVRLSLVNLYLHGFNDPHIWEYDTLSSEERWDETADVILANPPFMSPKGGIRPHKKFSISSNRSEVLFVDYIAEHLNPKGRAGIIVPEGVIFQSGTAYKELRKMLVENYLYAVVSLPAGVFNPYSGVKTSILLMDAAFAKTSNEILFVKIENDGYGLGAQRTPVKGSQLEEAIELLRQFKEGSFTESALAHAIAKNEIAKNGDYNLSGERYKTTLLGQTEFDLFELDELFEIKRGGSPRPIEDYITEDENGINWIKIGDVAEGAKYITSTKEKIKPEGLKKSRLVEPGDFILSNSMSFGRPYIVNITGAIHDGWLVFKQLKNNLNKDYIFRILSSDYVKNQFLKSATGGVVKNLNIDLVKKVQIPLPPLSIQEEIVAEIEGWQKIIDGAKAVTENYKPKIDINPEWEMVELGELVIIQTGGTPSKSNNKFWEGDIPWVSPKDMKQDFIDDSEDHISQKAVEDSSTKIVPEKTILIVVRSGILKHTIPIALTTKPVSFNQDIIAIQTSNKRLSPEYLFYYLKSTSDIHLSEGIKPGVTVQSFHNGYFKKIKIPLVSLETQRQIVSQIEKEQALVNTNKQLIEIFEQKIKDRIAKVWGADKAAPVLYLENDELTMAAEE
ncbi:MAG TPA: N-6 DNA methylase, partial [Chitinophagaceae bacterium]|nr:N-6 DNA methylase [Chitinophagaceae bacterium]